MACMWGKRATRPSVQEFVEKLYAEGGQKLGDSPLQIRARCACHDDRNPSGSYTITRGNDGAWKLLAHCLSNKGNLYQALKEANWNPTFNGHDVLWGAPLRGGSMPGKKTSTAPTFFPAVYAGALEPPSPSFVKHMMVVRSFAYRDLDGGLLGFEDRFERLPGVDEKTCAAKSVLPRFFLCEKKGDPDGTSGVIDAPEWRRKFASAGHRPLYNLPSLKEFPEATWGDLTNVFFFVDGPKTVEAAKQLVPGVPFLSPSNGRNGLKAADLSPVQGRTPIVVPDADEDWSAGLTNTWHVLQAKGFTRMYVVKPTPEMVALNCGWDLADALEGKLPSKSFDAVKWLKTYELFTQEDWLAQIKTKEDVFREFEVLQDEADGGFKVFYHKEARLFSKGALNFAFSDLPDFRFTGTGINRTNNVGGLTPYEYIIKQKGKERVLKRKDYLPGEGSVVYDKETHSWVLNVWRPGYVRPIQGDVDPYVRHVAYQFPLEGRSADESFALWKSTRQLSLEAFEYLSRKTHQLRFPMDKIKSAFLWSGKQGTGKTNFEQAHFPIFGESNCSVTTAAGLGRGWTTAFECKQLVCCEELSEVEDDMDIYENTKTVITNDKITRNEKYEREDTIQNRSHLTAITNFEIPFKIKYEPNNERRWFFAVSPAVARTEGYYDELFTWLEDVVNLAAVKHFLMFEFDLAPAAHGLGGLYKTPVWSADAKPPMTKGKQLVIDSSRPAEHLRLKMDIQRGTFSNGSSFPDICSVKHLKSLLSLNGYLKSEGDYKAFIKRVKFHLEPICTTKSELGVQCGEEPLWKETMVNGAPVRKIDDAAIRARDDRRGTFECAVVRNHANYYLKSERKLFDLLPEDDPAKTGFRVMAEQMDLPAQKDEAPTTEASDDETNKREQ